MSAQDLGSRAIIGQYFMRLEMGAAGWVDRLGMRFTSDQNSETYKFLGLTPMMREWTGGRQPKGLRTNGFTIENKLFESTLKVLVDELRRDKTGQIMVRINELADRTNDHWAKLLSTLIDNAAATACYDDQFFFDTDHSEESSGTQSNLLSITLSTLPVAAGPDKGTPDTPSPEQLMHCVMRAVQQIYSFKDNQGEPMNSNAREFMIMVPTRLWGSMVSAVALPNLAQGVSNIIPGLTQSAGLRFDVVPNPRLDSSWGLSGSPEQGEFAVFRTDGNIKPFILQTEQDVAMDVIGEGSEHAFMHREHLYGVTTIRNVGYGYWQGACKVVCA